METITRNLWPLRRVTLQLISAVFLSVSAFADTIWLEWDRNSDTNVAGYRVYYGQSSRAYDSVIEASNETAVVLPVLASGKTYYFAVTAYSIDALESDFSEEVSYSQPRTNGPPIAVADAYETLLDTPLNVSILDGVLDNDFDAEEDPLTATLVSATAHGTLTLNASGAFTYSPAAGFTGTDSFTYRCSDDKGLFADVAVTINVLASLPPNNVPVAQANTYQVAANTTLNVTTTAGLLNNDFDADGDTLSALLMSGPSHGTLNLANNGSFVYSPAGGYTGNDTFTYSCADGEATSTAATVTITITGGVTPPPNVPPVAQPDSFETSQDTLLTASGVLQNDSDVDGDPLTVLLSGTTAHGVLNLNVNGSFTYLPTSEFAGTDFFTYAVTDGKATSAVATVTIIVSDGTNAPACPECLVQLEQIITARGSSYSSLLQKVKVPENSTCLETALIQFYTLARTLGNLNDSEMNVALEAASGCLAANLETELAKRQTKINGLLPSKWVGLARTRALSISNQLYQASSIESVASRTKKLMSAVASLRRVDAYISSGRIAPATLSNQVLWCRFSISGRTVQRLLNVTANGLVIVQDIDGTTLRSDAYVYERTAFDSAQFSFFLDGPEDFKTLTLKFAPKRGKISGDLRGYFTLH